MSRIPGGREVDRALKAADQAVRAALKAVNLQANKLLVRGDYAGAERMVSAGRSVSDYQEEIEGLRRRWRSVRSSSGQGEGESSESTALWEYYKPILQALESLGGEATRREIEQRVESELTSFLKRGDRRTMARGNPQWKATVSRARKHLVREGFLEEATGVKWRITPAGRHAARGEIQTGREG